MRCGTGIGWLLWSMVGRDWQSCSRLRGSASRGSGSAARERVERLRQQAVMQLQWQSGFTKPSTRRHRILGSMPNRRLIYYEAMSGTPPTSVWDPRFLFYPESKEHLLSNVKWGKGGGADDLPLLQYLRSVTQLIASEARDAGVGKLEFRWSYPMALPEGARGAMGNFWDGVAHRLSRPGGMVVT